MDRPSGETDKSPPDLPEIVAIVPSFPFAASRNLVENWAPVLIGVKKYTPLAATKNPPIAGNTWCSSPPASDILHTA